MAAIAAQNPAVGSAHSLLLAPSFIQAPDAGRIASHLPLGHRFSQGLNTDSPRRVFVGPRYGKDPAAALPHGIPAGPRLVHNS